MVDPDAVELVQGVGVGVDLDDAERGAGEESTQDGEGDRVVAAHRDRADVMLTEPAEEGGDGVDARQEIERVRDDVADIGYLAELEREDAGRRVDATDQARRLAHLGRSVPRTRPVGQAQIERHADQPDVDPRQILDQRRPHEGGDADEAGDSAGVDRQLESIGGHKPVPSHEASTRSRQR